MKKTLCAICALTIASPAFANHQPSIASQFEGTTFETYGQCISALMRERNEQRQEHHSSGYSVSNKDYNESVKDTYLCDQNEDGDWIIVDLHP